MLIRRQIRRENIVPGLLEAMARAGAQADAKPMVMAAGTIRA
jgi:hypothetical protein